MSLADIQIAAHHIGTSHPPYIVAEMSGNHNGSLDKALEIVDAAAATGVQALKLQTYTADTMTIDLREGDFFISDKSSLWHGKSLYELYQEAHTPWDWHGPIMERCEKHGMTCFSTPFDESAVDFLENLNVPAYKVASFENTDIALIRKVASTGKPVIISSGMATLDELQESVNAFKDAGGTELVLLKCTSSYPASPADTNILTIPDMRERFGVQVGLSDHTLGIGVAAASISLGATFVEKHFVLDRSEGGVDSAFSLEPQELKALVEECERAWQALGKINYEPVSREKDSLQFRRSLYVVEDIAEGQALTTKNVRAIRPGRGLAPKHLNEVLKHKAATDLKRGTPLSMEHLK